MTCPFLNEAQVKYCRTAALRMLIPRAQNGAAAGKCVSPSHTTCPAFRAHPVDGSGATCPYLEESLMQYCSAAPVTKLVPYSESLLSRCGNDTFRYCELYLGMAHPGLPADAVDGVGVPGWLRYSANHMWLDITDDGACHVGIDALLARALGKVDTVTYVWLKGRHRPAAVFTIEGVELELVFPNPLLLTNCNLYVRAKPSRVSAQPYTAGWLFEGVTEPDTAANLLEGAAAQAWMDDEQRRMNDLLQRLTGVAADGGLPRPGILCRLEREHRLTLFHEFFSPFASGKR
jgi:glycine cleavage system H lipoate-binding protein